MEWETLSQPDSKLCKFLTSEPFAATPIDENPAIDVHSLTLFAVIHCSGTPKAKAQALLSQLQTDDQPVIASSDKDYVPVFAKLCQLALLDFNGTTPYVCSSEEME